MNSQACSLSAINLINIPYVRHELIEGFVSSIQVIQLALKECFNKQFRPTIV
jgi:hypothetical protein